MITHNAKAAQHMTYREFGIYLLAAMAAVVLFLAGLAASVFFYEPGLRPGFGAAASSLYVVDGNLRCPVLSPSVVDGDTVSGSVVLPWQAGIVGAKIRAADYDAWELTSTRRTVTVTPEEIERGKAAAAALQSLVHVGKLYVEPTRPSGSRDLYGRLLGTLWVRTPDADWIDVGLAMRQNGHTRPSNAETQN